MRQAMSKVTRVTRQRAGLMLAAVLTVAAISAFTAAPARAGSEFDDGFEDQLGRLVAGEVFHLGKWVLAGGPHYAHPGYAEPVHYRPHHKRRHFRHHRQHWRKLRRHYWRRHHGHHHGYGEACRFERVRRHHYRHDDDHDDERHERRHRDRDRYARR